MSPNMTIESSIFNSNNKNSIQEPFSDLEITRALRYLLTYIVTPPSDYQKGLYF